MNTNANLKIHNRFDFVLKRGDDVIQTAKAENVVLNQLFDNYNGKVSSGRRGRAIKLVLGTGTTTPAVTDTDLAHRVYNQRVDSYEWALEANNVTKVVVHKTVTETEAIGLLSEVGLWGSESDGAGGCLATRALITDSEDNPITIDKTVADILEVTATVYFQVTVTSPYKLLRGAVRAQSCTSTDPDIIGTDMPVDATTQDVLPGLIPDTGFQQVLHFRSLKDAGYTEGAYSVWGVTRPILPWLTATNANHALFNINSSNQLANNELIRCTSSSVASTAQNRAVTYLIKSIILPGGFLLQFPNSAVYPPKQLTLKLTGDGATTDFDFPVPELSTSNVSVSINGVVQDPSTYTFSGKNFTMQQAWCSSDTRYLVKSGYTWFEDSASASTNRGLFTLEYPASYYQATIHGSYKPTTMNPRVYDFESPKTVNTFKNTVTTSASATDTVSLEYSTDGETWTQAASISARNADSATFSPISARYWRIVGIPCVSSGSSKTITDADVLFGFDDVQPGIHFATAPALNDSIEVTCYCDYPMKNENWRIDSIVSDIKYTRGANP